MAELVYKGQLVSPERERCQGTGRWTRSVRVAFDVSDTDYPA